VKPPPPLAAFAAVAFAYFGYGGLFGTYAPLWFQSLGYGALAIGTLASVQSATRLFSPYAWGWLADHSGKRTELLRLAVVLALIAACGYFVPGGYGWTVAVTVGLFLCTAGMLPISEAALAQVASRAGGLDARRYGRVRVWGSIGFVVAVLASGSLLQRNGIGLFPWLVVALLSVLLGATLRLPLVADEAPHAASVQGVLAVLRTPVVGWFFAGVFFTVLAHTSLYAFLSLYLASLGYAKGTVGLVWAVGVVAEVGWFGFQRQRAPRWSNGAWLIVAAAVSVPRFALTAAYGARPTVLIAVQCLHAVTFAAQHLACVAMLNRHFPGRLRGRGQALYSVLGYGVSGVVGGVGGGALSEACGYAAVFWAASVAAALATLCTVRGWVLERRTAAAC
jgi:MFS transporter, PPP family, 3-phenylpropionic acid transporter